MTIAYFDCFSGISGDMALGALIDAGGDATLVEASVEAMQLGDEVKVAVRPAERAEPQEFKVDVKVDADLAAPGTSDRVEDTVDYRQIYNIAKGVVEGESAKLIETLAERIADRVLEVPRVATVSVRVAKRPQSMRPIDAAAVKIKRTRA